MPYPGAPAAWRALLRAVVIASGASLLASCGGSNSSNTAVNLATVDTLYSFAAVTNDQIAFLLGAPAYSNATGPNGSLVQGPDGSFYGTTSQTVFRITAA